jgi:hypothetical protein
MADGAFTFVSWVRRGLAGGISQPDQFPAGTPDIGASVTVRFNGDADEAFAELNLVGPGDIVGLDSNVIVRTWPPSDDPDAEFRSYALLEFDQADLPWRYTPAKHSGEVGDGSDHLRPWFSLLVLEASEGSVAPSTPERPLPVLTVTAPGNLPDPNTAWAWAHTQFEGQDIDPGQAASKITGQPGLFTARLMSPRLLRAGKEYIACLVPTFERGRLIGLGMDPGNTDALAPAWDPSASNALDLPVYFFWRFTTGSLANFEEAARLIKPFVLPPSIGRRDMDVAEPGQELPEAAEGSLPVEGALLSVAAFEQGTPEWSEPKRGEFIEALKELVNAPAEADASKDPILAPPLYGQWYSADDTLNEPRPTPGGTNPPWYHQLNSDPRNRVAAALGTKVIQNEQQALLASGWDQVEELKTINEKLRVLQLGRGMLTRIYKRHFVTASEQRFYHLTARVQARINCGSQTVCKRIDNSPIFPGFLSAQWRRLSAPLGAIGRVQGRAELTNYVSDLLSQLNQCRGPAPDPKPPGGFHDPRGNPLHGGPSCDVIETLIELGSDVLLHWGLVILWVARKLLVTEVGDCWWIGIRALRFAIVLIQIATSPDDVRRRCRYRNGTFTIQDVLNGPRMPTFVGYRGVPFPLPAPQIPGGAGASDNALAAEIRAAIAQVWQLFEPRPVLDCAPPMDLGQCRISLETSLHPSVTVGRDILTRISTDVSVDWTPADPLEPMLIHPEYERPMYEPLRDISTDWILPGLNQIKRDTVGLAVMNQRFIEAYMTGLNQEMTRELFWNEFPTDQRGTYFRQFWSIASHILENGSTLPPAQLRDIDPIRQWSKNADLGGNSPRPAPPGGAGLPFLVLVVRAQLIQKYPNVIVYAQQVNAARTSLTGEQRFPIFDARIDPDVAFFGFDLTAQQVRDNDRWYFVLQEQPGEPKFADEETDRTDENQKYTTDLGPFGNSAGVLAEQTFLQPFRLGIQASVLLPPEEE